MRPRLHVRFTFHDNICALIYALATSQMYTWSAVGHEQEAARAAADGFSEEFEALWALAADQRQLAAKFRHHAVTELERLYNITEEHVPRLEALARRMAAQWHEMGATINEIGKQIARDEGLSEEHAERRMVYTLIGWR